jgi:hypothetical protein
MREYEKRLMPNENLTLSGSVQDLKLVYRVLHAHLTEHVELVDSELFSSLQSVLQQCAKADGVDVTDHEAWDVWLGNPNAAPCEVRLELRRPLPS